MKPTDILFKAKRVDNGEWVEGELIKTDIGSCITTYDDIDLDCNYEGSRFGGSITAIHIDLSTLCIWTTLTDKNGKKVFSGDVVIDSGCSLNGCYEPLYYIVRWDEPTLSFVFDAYGYVEERIDYFSGTDVEYKDTYTLPDMDLDSLTIHDNPELIEE